MRLIALPIAALALIAAKDTPAPPAMSEPEATMRELYLHNPAEAYCRDRITKAREDAGKPPLIDREPASPGKPYHIYAVDKRIDGCAVMVMHGDVTDIRPTPERPDGPIRL
ncbi:MAG: hypothetical protein V2I74_02355, partial [Erythrobacter sp.]|nr:hypothetical protein [Erythrobacter sp.]